MASATIQYNIHDYLSAESVLKGREQKKIGNNTWLRRTGPRCIAVKYHNTYIAQFTPEWAVYDSGGWQTYTTKDRLNQLLPSGVSLYQHKFRWFIHDRRTNEEYPWEDGIGFPTIA